MSGALKRSLSFSDEADDNHGALNVREDDPENDTKSHSPDRQLRNRKICKPNLLAKRLKPTQSDSSTDNRPRDSIARSSKKSRKTSSASHTFTRPWKCEVEGHLPENLPGTAGFTVSGSDWMEPYLCEADDSREKSVNPALSVFVQHQHVSLLRLLHCEPPRRGYWERVWLATLRASCLQHCDAVEAKRQRGRHEARNAEAGTSGIQEQALVDMRADHEWLELIKATTDALNTYKATVTDGNEYKADLDESVTNVPPLERSWNSLPSPTHPGSFPPHATSDASHSSFHEYCRHDNATPWLLPSLTTDLPRPSSLTATDDSGFHSTLTPDCSADGVKVPFSPPSIPPPVFPATAFYKDCPEGSGGDRPDDAVLFAMTSTPVLKSPPPTQNQHRAAARSHPEPAVKTGGWLPTITQEHCPDGECPDACSPEELQLSAPCGSSSARLIDVSRTLSGLTPQSSPIKCHGDVPLHVSPKLELPSPPSEPPVIPHKPPSQDIPHEPPAAIPHAPQYRIGRHRLRYFTPSSRKVLEDWYRENEHFPYAGDAVAEALAGRANLNRAQVMKWLSNRRNRDGNTKRRAGALTGAHSDTGAQSDGHE